MKNRISAPTDVLNALSSPARIRSAAAAARHESRLGQLDEPSKGIGQDRPIGLRELQPVGRLLPHEVLADVADLAGVGEQHEAHGAGDRNQVLDVAEQALVAADDDARERIARPHRPDIEPAHAVLAAEEQLLEDRQHRRAP
jgi:hypothetical protein